MNRDNAPLELLAMTAADSVGGHGARVELDPENVSSGLAQLVLTIVELLRDLMERQAIVRMDAGGLDADQIEDLGSTLRALDQNMDVLVREFGLTRGDLNLDLGPLGTLL